jgi:hypothetical protein
MIKTPIKLVLITAIILTLATSSCYYDNEEDLYPGSSTCDTNNVTYSASVAPVFAGYCNSCHSGSAPSAGIKTDTYTSVTANIISIRGAINHEPGYLAMPQNGGKLPGCDLTKIDIWIRLGMPNN